MEEFVGTNSLEAAPAVMSGLASVARAPALERARQAVFNLRQITLAFATRESVKHAVALYNEQHRSRRTQGPYRIDPETLKFERTDHFEDPAITRARQILSQPLPYQVRDVQLADPAQEMTAQLGDDPLAPRVPVGPITAPLPPRRTHDINREPARPISVPMSELVELAREMDAREVEQPERRPGNWEARMKRFALMIPRADQGLVEGNVLRLEQLKHLIGLPGAGKTTLLVVLGVWLGRRCMKAMLLFPSIEVARQYMSDLAFHGVRVGMLVGQNSTTRRRHADRIAETIASAGGQGGFASTIEGASAFAANCVLPAFARGDTGFWRFGHAPCDAIMQGTDQRGRPRRRLCPVWTVCGRNQAPRSLIDADVWVGHVLSMDTVVPAQALDDGVRYFELIARSFDLVVFDEADAVQSNLDSYGAATLKISGAEDSVHRAILDQIHDRFARGENHRLMDRNIELYSRDLSEFGSHNYSLVSMVQNLVADPAGQRVARHFCDQLLTTSRIIADLLDGLSRRRPRRDDAEIAEVRHGFTVARAITDLWDTAAYEAFNNRTEDRPSAWIRADLCARILDVHRDELERQRAQLIKEFRRYLAENLNYRRDGIVERIAELFLAICFPREVVRPAGADEAVSLLVTVTFMILGYRRIIPGTRTMVAEGLVREPLIATTASEEMRRFIPESVMGSLSGVKYSLRSAESSRVDAVNVELSYITLVGAPRMLMHRFHRLLESDGNRAGPAVLLTSATSFLEASPAYHIGVGPHYVLRPREAEHDAASSSYRFKWIPDRERGDEPLRYSGAGALGPRNLERMVEALVRGGTAKSEVYKSIRNFDVRGGVCRKAALVVNGYEQARAIKAFLDDHHREIGRRTKAVVRDLGRKERPADYVTPAQAEALGDDENCDIVVLPMSALGRGTNIVFTKGPRLRDAAIGSIYFLTRPHPSADDMQLMLSMAGRDTQALDERVFEPAQGADDVAAEVHAARHKAFKLARRLLQEPLMASRLGAELFRPFTANQMVNILQTIGRGMRNGCPVAVYFVDAAWAPKSTRGEPDSPQSSMLVQMRVILEQCVAHADPVARQVYKELYSAFLDPLRRIEGVEFPPELRSMNDSDSEYNDDGFDGPDPLLED
ncbi:hypothetical protein WME94_19935 [Sorangium sp. So ce429]